MKFRLISELKRHYPVHYANGEEVPKVPTSEGTEPPVLKLPETQPAQTNEVKDIDPRITITINSNGLDKNGLAGDITINIESERD